MRTPINGVTPEAWLSRQGLSQDKRSEVLDSFRADSVVRVFTYQAPHLFLRAHGKRSRDPIFKPNYWADGNVWGSAYDRAGQFELFLSDDEIRLIARNYYRELTAICHNWNDLDMSSFWKISLRGSEIVEGIEGPAAAQPMFDADSRTGAPASASQLPGGGLQVFLNPKTPFICTPVTF